MSCNGIRECSLLPIRGRNIRSPCFIPTEELYKLVIEWKEMEERMKRGEDSFPVTLVD